MKLAERLKALEQNKDSWKSRLSREKSEDVAFARKSLECRRSELVQASDDWRKRLRTEESSTPVSQPALRLSSSASQSVRNFTRSGCIPHLPTTNTAAPPSSPKSTDKENVSSSCLLRTPKRVTAASRRPPSRLAKILGSSSENTCSLKRCFELGKEFNPAPTNHFTVKPTAEKGPAVSRRATPFKPPPANQTPVVLKEHCGVKLRELETKSSFPEVMLIRAKGSRQSEMSVRLVCPLGGTCLQTASYLLVTRTRLFVFNSEQSTVSERAKVSQMAYEIIAGKEMACTAARLEIANDDPNILADFYRAIGRVRQARNVEDGKETDYLEDVVYEVVDVGRMQVLATGEPPTTKCFDADKILVFDFVTEVYVWVGKNADRQFIKSAVEQAKKLTRNSFSTLAQQIFCIPSDSQQSKPTDWTIQRKFSQGIVDCLFRHKFDDWPASDGTPFHTPLSQQSMNRPWSMPAAYQLGKDSNSRRFASTFSTNSIGMEGILKNEEEMAVQLASSFPVAKPQPTNLLHLEGLDLRHNDENIFTEALFFYQLRGEKLLQLEYLEEFDDQGCYVLEWSYRVEREGVRKLNGEKIIFNHETGRQRKVFFYWLGSRSSIKDQSKCALALRDYDEARQEHIRVEQGLEPAIFLALLNGEMVVKGSETGWFLIIGGQDPMLYSAEELYMPIGLRTQSAYIQVVQEERQIVVWKGDDCPETVLEASKRLATKMAKAKGMNFDDSSEDIVSVSQMNNFSLLKPREWSEYPRLFRIYETEGHELSSLRCCKAINFSFRQSDLRDCVIVDQGNHLWIWAENSRPVTTFALRVAHCFWLKKKLEKGKSTVISEGTEPDEFKALFPTWKEPSLHDGYDDHSVPRLLEELLHERTKPRTIQELKLRNLPKGCDTKHLEKYLTDNDFQLTFGFTKAEYEALPRWKQISLKKNANLF